MSELLQHTQTNMPYFKENQKGNIFAYDVIFGHMSKPELSQWVLYVSTFGFNMANFNLWKDHGNF